MEEKTTQHIHTHGPSDGEGLECPEIRLSDETFMGMCTPYGKHQAANRVAFQQALETSMTDSDFLLAQAEEEKKHARLRAESLAFVPQNEPMDYIAAAKSYVRYSIGVTKGKSTEPYEVYVVWFTKTLQNWKAVVCTTLPDGMLYEVTHNGDKRETYVDAYKKQNNIVIPD